MSEVHSPRRRSFWRWLAVLAISLLAHLLLLGWAGGYLSVPDTGSEPPPVIIASIVTPPPPPPPPAPPPKPKPKPRPKPQPARQQVTPVQETENASAAVQSTEAEPALQTQPEAPVPAAEPPAPPPAADEGTTQAAADKFDPPPSARLDYDVTALREGQNWYGAGSFHWEAVDGRYSITGEASVRLLFKITVLNFRSEGAINQFGIAPALYNEQPWRKAMTSTRFEPQEGRISFSASGRSHPYQDGAQDRASLVWQMAAIGRGDPARIAPGAELELLVAGTRNAEPWRIRVIGEEEVSTGHGAAVAWHLRRDPHPGSRDQAVDFWLAPQLEWYPVRIRYTYANNDFLDMSLSDLTPGASRPTP